MTDIIKVLPEHIANQIAAGEVINRPANAVKELMENAVDAHATSIKVVVRGAGKELIRVIDNGIGMSPQDAHNSFLRHATSKISSAEDLFRLHTKGFRGEALASIAAVAQVEMITRRAEDELATKIEIDGTKYTSKETVAAPVGTSLSVKNLFYNIPARRNFLKADTSEMNRIVDEFTRVALAHPEIAFQLYRGDDPVYSLPVASLRRRIVGLFRSNTDNKLVPIEEKTPDATIYGFVYKPEYAKMKGADQFIFVNNRYVKSSYLSNAVLSAFQGLIPDRHYPGYFLYFEIDPSKIDINISPTKTEISFDDERTIYSFLRATVRHSLG
ncbi:MAG: DNA mismatch repair endonuclease MutL, partial [Flavobacteriales bacterium]|nr:DNA mismatch repair endonuclease MutL [Flavobacteriales bacterium]